MDIKLILVFSCLLILSQATHMIPVRVHHLRKDLDSKLIGIGDDAKPKKHSADVALTLNAEVNGDSYLVAFDSSTNLMWLPSTDCKSTFCLNAKHRIDVTNKDSPVTGSNGKIEGYKVKVDVKIGTTVANGVDIIAAEYVDNEVVKKLPHGVDGVMSFDVFNHLKPEQDIVSLHLNKKNPKDNGFYFGEEYLRGLTDNAVELKKVPFIPSEDGARGRVALDYISNTNGPWRTWCIEGGELNLDLHYSGISGPCREVESINRYIGTDDDGYIDCEQVPWLQPLIFHTHIGPLSIPPTFYIRSGKRSFDVRCKSRFEPHYSARNTWTLGVADMLDGNGPFKQFATVFKVGAARPELAFVKVK